MKNKDHSFEESRSEWSSGFIKYKCIPGKIVQLIPTRLGILQQIKLNLKSSIFTEYTIKDLTHYLNEK